MDYLLRTLSRRHPDDTFVNCHDIHFLYLYILGEGVQRLEDLDEEDLVLVSWGELKSLIRYNQIISQAFMETSEIFVNACNEIREGDEEIETPS